MTTLDRLSLRAARHWASPANLYWDPRRDPVRSTLIVSSRRSGSTLLAEALTSRRRVRHVFEPFRFDTVPAAHAVQPALYLEPGTPSAEVAQAVDRILGGAVRAEWCDRFNTSRLPRCRVIKDVRINNLAPWIATRHPEVVTIYLLRHPLAVAWSLTELGWGYNNSWLAGQAALLDGPLREWRAEIAAWTNASLDTLALNVLSWCMENVVPSRMLPPDRTHVVFYEHLVCRPQEELNRLAAFLACHSSTWRAWRPKAELLTRDSSTDYRNPDHSRNVEDRLSEWQDRVSPAAQETAFAILSAFGFDRIYGAGLYPRTSPDTLLGTL